MISKFMFGKPQGSYTEESKEKKDLIRYYANAFIKASRTGEGIPDKVTEQLVKDSEEGKLSDKDMPKIDALVEQGGSFVPLLPKLSFPQLLKVYKVATEEEKPLVEKEIITKGDSLSKEEFEKHKKDFFKTFGIVDEEDKSKFSIRDSGKGSIIDHSDNVL
jgi:hypothetical protein